MKKKMFFFLLLFTTLFLCCSKEAAAEKKQQSVLIVTDSKQEAEFFEMLAREYGLVFYTVYEAEYEAGMTKQFDCLITASALPLLEAKEQKKRALILGEACGAMGLSKLKNYQNVSLELSYLELRQRGIFLKTVCTFDEYEGEGFGTLLIGERKEVPVFVKTGSFYLMPYYQTEGVFELLAEDAAAGCFGLSSGGKENRTLLETDNEEAWLEEGAQEAENTNQKTSLVLFFEKGNHILVVLVFFGILLLLLLLVYGRKWYRKKFIR